MSTDSAVRLASGCLWRELPNGDVELTVPESWPAITQAHDYFAGIPDRTLTEETNATEQQSAN